MYIFEKDTYITEIPRTGSCTMVHYFDKMYQTSGHGHLSINTALWWIKRIPSEVYAIIRNPVDRFVSCVNQNFRMDNTAPDDLDENVDLTMRKLCQLIDTKKPIPVLFVSQSEYIDAPDVRLVPFDDYKEFMGKFGVDDPENVFREEKPISVDRIKRHKLYDKIMSYYEPDFALYDKAKVKGALQ